MPGKVRTPLKPIIQTLSTEGNNPDVLILARFRLDKDREKMVDVLIPRRSLYIMK